MKRSHRYQQIASKMYKTLVLKKDIAIHPYIPETKWLHPKGLIQMLEDYSTIFVKPDKGGGAGGIVRLEKKDGLVECKSPYGKKKIVSIDHLNRWLQSVLKKNKRYIMQQGIRLAKIDQRPFDLRIHLQKPQEAWIVTGMCAKVAAPGQVVTNFCKGGTPYKATEALLRITSEDKHKAGKILYELYHLSKEIAKDLNFQFKGLKELGIDIGIDEDLKIWIFEVNTRPRFNMFRKLGDLYTYRKIKKIQRHILKRKNGEGREESNVI